MGAWGTGPFDNDVAADWVLEVEDADDPREAVIEAFTATLAPGGLDDGSADMAYAAAAWLVTQHGGSDDGAPSVPAPRLDPMLSDLATRSLQHMITDDSEWLELWGDSEAEVVEQVTNVLQQLTGRAD